MSRARVHPAVAALLSLLAVAIVGGSAAAQDALRFPKPDRPVARIITPCYSTEEARDRHGEAQRVMDRLGVKPGMPPDLLRCELAALGYHEADFVSLAPPMAISPSSRHPRRCARQDRSGRAPGERRRRAARAVTTYSGLGVDLGVNG